jgi:hypothetical protein
MQQDHSWFVVQPNGTQKSFHLDYDFSDYSLDQLSSVSDTINLVLVGRALMLEDDEGLYGHARPDGSIDLKTIERIRFQLPAKSGTTTSHALLGPDAHRQLQPIPEDEARRFLDELESYLRKPYATLVGRMSWQVRQLDGYLRQLHFRVDELPKYSLPQLLGARDLISKAVENDGYSLLYGETRPDGTIDLTSIWGTRKSVSDRPGKQMDQKTLATWIPLLNKSIAFLPTMLPIKLGKAQQLLQVLTAYLSKHKNRSAKDKVGPQSDNVHPMYLEEIQKNAHHNRNAATNEAEEQRQRLHQVSTEVVGTLQQLNQKKANLSRIVQDLTRHRQMMRNEQKYSDLRRAEVQNEISALKKNLENLRREKEESITALRQTLQNTARNRNTVLKEAQEQKERLAQTSLDLVKTLEHLDRRKKELEKITQNLSTHRETMQSGQEQNNRRRAQFEIEITALSQKLQSLVKKKDDMVTIAGREFRGGLTEIGNLKFDSRVNRIDPERKRLERKVESIFQHRLLYEGSDKRQDFLDALFDFVDALPSRDTLQDVTLLRMILHSLSDAQLHSTIKRLRWPTKRVDPQMYNGLKPYLILCHSAVTPGNMITLPKDRRIVIVVLGALRAGFKVVGGEVAADFYSVNGVRNILEKPTYDWGPSSILSPYKAVYGPRDTMPDQYLSFDDKSATVRMGMYELPMKSDSLSMRLNILYGGTVQHLGQFLQHMPDGLYIIHACRGCHRITDKDKAALVLQVESKQVRACGTEFDPDLLNFPKNGIVGQNLPNIWGRPSMNIAMLKQWKATRSS